MRSGSFTTRTTPNAALGMKKWLPSSWLLLWLAGGVVVATIILVLTENASPLSSWSFLSSFHNHRRHHHSMRTTIMQEDVQESLWVIPIEPNANVLQRHEEEDRKQKTWHANDKLDLAYSPTTTITAIKTMTMTTQGRQLGNSMNMKQKKKAHKNGSSKMKQSMSMMMMKKKKKNPYKKKDIFQQRYRPRTITAEINVVCRPGDEVLRERIPRLPNKGRGRNGMMMMKKNTKQKSPKSNPKKSMKSKKGGGNGMASKTTSRVRYTTYHTSSSKGKKQHPGAMSKRELQHHHQHRILQQSPTNGERVDVLCTWDTLPFGPLGDPLSEACPEVTRIRSTGGNDDSPSVVVRENTCTETTVRALQGARPGTYRRPNYNNDKEQSTTTPATEGTESNVAAVAATTNSIDCNDPQATNNHLVLQTSEGDPVEGCINIEFAASVPFLDLVCAGLDTDNQATVKFFTGNTELVTILSPLNIGGPSDLWILSETTCVGTINRVTRVEICLPPGGILLSLEYQVRGTQAPVVPTPPPTMMPTVSPTLTPTHTPTFPLPTSLPTEVPTTASPTGSPIDGTVSPTFQGQTATPSVRPSDTPSSWPSVFPSVSPSVFPSSTQPSTGAPTQEECLLPISSEATWSAVPANSEELNIGQHEGCFVLANNGKGYAIGGRIRSPVCEYDPTVRTWKCSDKTIPLRLHHMQCLAIGDDIWIPSAWTGTFPDEDNVSEIYIYSPATDSWSTRPGLPVERQRGSAAAVYDERTNSIYISHGNNGGHNAFSNALTMLDRYDIDTSTWTPLANGIIPRDHTGGAIINGELCVAAGRNGTSVANTILPSECYNIANNTWELRAEIAVGRAGSAYGKTCDGRLMVAGGESPGKAHDEVSVFDGNSWEELGSLAIARHGTGLAVDCSCNQIYIAGGSPEDGGPPDNGGLQITEHFLPNGVDEICANVVTECETPESGASWTIVGSPDAEFFEGQSTACFVHGENGKSYLIGGYKKTPLCVYDPNLRSWECQTENFPKRTHHSQCLVVGDNIWFMTGWGNRFGDDESPIVDAEVPTVQKYNYITDTWEFKRGIDESRYRAGAAAAYYEGYIYLSHGSTDSHTNGASVLFDRYNIDTDTWETLPDANFARDHTGGGIIGGQFCVAGGRDSSGNQVAETECYDIDSGTWSSRAPLEVPRSHSSYGTTCDGRLMVAGGENEEAVLSDVSVFDGTSWEAFPPLKIPRHGTTTLAMDCPCGQIYMATGASEPGNVEDGLPAFATEHYFPDGIDQVCEKGDPSWAVVPAPLVSDWEDQSTACFVQGNNGKAYLIGGYKKTPLCVYDPDIRSWECQTTNFPKRTHHSQCIVIGDEIWFMTGWSNRITDDESPILDAEVSIVQTYNYITDTWDLTRKGIDLSRYRAGAAAAHFEGKIYLSHGSTDSHTAGASVLFDVYDIATDTWTELPDASLARDHTGGGIVNGEFCVAGGRDSSGNQVEVTECYNIFLGVWFTRPSLSKPRSHSSYGTTCDGRLMVAGGEDSSGALTDVSVFDGASWEEFPSLQIARHGTTTIAVDCRCGQFYMATGASEPGNVENGLGPDSTEHFFPHGVDETCQ